MSDEVQETTTEETVTEVQDTTESQEQPAEANTVDNLPDWAQGIIKDLRQENAKHRTEKQKALKAQEQAKQKALEDQGEFQQLNEELKAQVADLAAKAQAAELARIRTEIAHKHNLSPELAKRLQGGTDEEMEADAQALLAAIPKAPAQTATDGAQGINQKPSTQLPDDHEIKEMAARFGVSFTHLKETLERQARS